MAGGGRLAGIRVVLVDDERDALDFLALVLENEGAEVAPFADPRAALEDLAAHPTHVILSDLYMPGMSGWELIEAARLRGVRSPAAALTAHASPENRSRCVAAGFCACLSKPLAPRALVDLVQELVQAGG
jgi:two-component system CheB/CheR fusion protein